MWRQRATGGDINTQFTGIPLNYSNAGQYSEFYGSGRQSRIALLATGKVESQPHDRRLLRGRLPERRRYLEQQREQQLYVCGSGKLWAQAHWDSLTFTGGQMWSLATETTKLTQNRSEILPSTIDPQYTAGFVWERQYGFRVSKDFGTKASVAISAENPQTLNIAWT